MKILSHFLVSMVFMFALIGDAIGAEISLTERKRDGRIIISGKIERGDLEKIKKSTATFILSQDVLYSKSLSFYLDTSGGDIEEAIKIGRYFREILASVESYGREIVAPGSEDEKSLSGSEYSMKDIDYVVLAPDLPLSEKDVLRNYSAGILIFYGAVERHLADNVDKRLGRYKKQTIPVMGIHRPYYEKEYFSKLSPAQAAEAYKKLEKEVREYLSEMGASQLLIDRMFNTASNLVDPVDDETFRKYYKPYEPFFEEWLIAKCGAVGEGYKKALKGKELDDYKEMREEQIALTMADKNALEKPFLYRYPSEKFSQDYIEEISRKVKMSGIRMESCRKTAVFFRQREWAKGYK